MTDRQISVTPRQHGRYDVQLGFYISVLDGDGLFQLQRQIRNALCVPDLVVELSDTTNVIEPCIDTDDTPQLCRICDSAHGASQGGRCIECVTAVRK